MSFRLLQWNSMYNEDPAAIGQFLRSVQPDIVCLQELTRNYLPQYADVGAHVAETLGYYGFYKYGPMRLPDGGQTLMGDGIFSRFELQERRRIVLQPGLVENGQVKRDERLYLGVQVTLPGGQVIAVGTTHLPFHPQFRASAAKRAMVERILAETPTEPYLLAGDFNATPSSWAGRRLRQGLRHAGPALAQKTWTTKPFAIGPHHYDQLRWRLDYVLHTTGVKVTKSELLQTSLSDHLPILVTFEVA
ncbi:MAG TPA: endonuclease/exonuclease/phosphatase family protein [Candidatus Saccharimonadia bacterium]|nr:endonuclease/exonuclease/phosphatase family protein [Candidatus Saccharimonadia bacterium]